MEECYMPTFGLNHSGKRKDLFGTFFFLIFSVVYNFTIIWRELFFRVCFSASDSHIRSLISASGTYRHVCHHYVQHLDGTDVAAVHEAIFWSYDVMITMVLHQTYRTDVSLATVTLTEQAPLYSVLPTFFILS